MIGRPGRRAAALALASLALAGGAGAARAQGAEPSRADLARAALPDAADWMSEAGRPAWTASSALGLGRPPAVAGLVLGGFRLVDFERAPEGSPYPGLLAARTPLADFDSLTSGPVARAPGGRPLLALSPVRDDLGAGGRPRATFALTNGDFGVDETSLGLERGGEAGRIRIEVLAARRGIAGPYGDAGRHRWDLSLARRFGKQEVSGAFRQAGVAARLQSGEEEASRGASGRLAWGWRDPRWRFDLGVSRQWDTRESFGGALAPASRRDAQQVRVDAAWTRHVGGVESGARLDWARARVARGGAGRFESKANDVWGTGWIERARVNASEGLELGAGHLGGVDRVEVAPAARIERGDGSRRVELRAERLLEPVWHDLGAGVRPFLQNTWVLGVLGETRAEASRLRLHAIAGRTRDRALVSRLPLTDAWLRAGARRDAQPWNFLLVTGEAAHRWRAIELGSEACGVVRGPGAEQRRVDPALTARAFAGGSFRTFGGDLGVSLRLEADLIGERATDEPAPRTLPGYVSGNAVVGFEIADARVTLRVRNLEDRRRDEVWVDRATGAPARGLPRELRVAVVWRLKN